MPLPVKTEPHYELRGTVSNVVTAYQHPTDWLLRHLLHATPTTSTISKKKKIRRGFGIPQFLLNEHSSVPISKNIKIYETPWRYTIPFKINSWTLRLYVIQIICYFIIY